MPNTNTTTYIVPQLLAQGLLALRNKCIMPALVNGNYSQIAAELGSTIDVPIPSAIAAGAVTPSNTPPDDTGISPTRVQISLDQWYEAPFFLNDKEMAEVMEGTIPMQASEAIAALANKVNATILAEYTGIYGYAGTAGTTPFASDVAAATTARRELNKQKAPMDPRYFVLDPDAEANALGLTQFSSEAFVGDANAIRNGTIDRRFGFAWFMDQQVPTHTTGATYTTCALEDASVVAGDTTTTLKGFSVKPSVGDIFTVNTDTQTRVIVTAATLTSSDESVVTFYPAIESAAVAAKWVNRTAVTFKATHVCNLAFHRDAFAFATRTLAIPEDGLGAVVRGAVDPISGLALRLEVTRQHKRTRWSYDILWGIKLVRPELACRVAG